MSIESILNYITYILVSAIIGIAIWAYYYIKNNKQSNSLVEKRRWIEQIPSLISTLGVLGTFIGITVGLCNFDTSDLDNSIPLLLSGLKTAFFTSIAGMVSSMFLSRYVSSKYDELDKGVSDINQAAGLITKSVSDMSSANIQTLTTMMQQQAEQLRLFEQLHNDNIEIISILKSSDNSLVADKIDATNLLLEKNSKALDRIYDNINESKIEDSLIFVSNTVKHLADNMSQNAANIESINNNVSASLEALGNLDESAHHVSDGVDKLSGVLQQEVGELNAVVKTQFAELSTFINKVNTQTASDILAKLGELESGANQIHNVLSIISHDTANIESINDNVATSLEALGNLDASEQHVSEEIDKLGIKMTGDISTIVVKMNETDKLLTTKFDEFTTLMKKNDVESLSEYMKKFAADFQSQMNNLINKLVADNFKELNKSISMLSIWQQENKAMIESLTQQYKDMADEFEETSTVLAEVGDNTGKLVADEGKLSELIQALNEVMAQDKTFLQVIDKMKDAADINKKNSQILNQSATNLNSWMVSQKDFVAGVERLVVKLDEISKFRNYNSEFWKDTKEKLVEGITILNEHTKKLKDTVAVIDKQFYSRLNTTLANLDACIQAMYNDKIR